jgi:hypothetical protein
MYVRVIAMTTVWVMSTRWVTSKNDEICEISSEKVDVLDSDMSEKVAPDRNIQPIRDRWCTRYPVLRPTRLTRTQ